MDKKAKVLISEKQIEQRVRELAEQISEDYEGKGLHIICILKGSVFFACDLMKRITVPVTIDFMAVSSYGNETTSSGRVRIVKDLDESIRDKDVIIVEDIIDSGRTLTLTELLATRVPASINICSLLDKPDRRVTDVEVKYVGFEIPDELWWDMV